jgi:hypothetical protein
MITYFDSIKLKTTVVLPNKSLKDQMLRLIGDVTLDARFLTMAEYYRVLHSDKSQVLIIDEFDEMVQHNPYQFVGDRIRAFW